MEKAPEHDLTPRQIRLIRYNRARWKLDFAALGRKFNVSKRVAELVCRGIIGAASDEMVEAPLPPKMSDPKEQKKEPRKCSQGHRFFGEECYQCYIASLPRPDAEAAEVS